MQYEKKDVITNQSTTHIQAITHKVNTERFTHFCITTYVHEPKGRKLLLTLIGL